MNYIVKEPDNLDWMSALSGVIGNNCVPWWGSDVTITPLIEDFRHNKVFKNVGYIIKINSWGHFAVVQKEGDRVYRILTPEHDWLKRCNGYTTYEDFDENEYKKCFWKTTLKLLRDHVDGEENLMGCTYDPEKSREELDSMLKAGCYWCHKCKKEHPISSFTEKEYGKYGLSSSCKDCDRKRDRDTAIWREWRDSHLVCCRCKKEGTSSDFLANKTGKYGDALWCKDCELQAGDK